MQSLNVSLGIWDVMDCDAVIAMVADVLSENGSGELLIRSTTICFWHGDYPQLS